MGERLSLKASFSQKFMMMREFVFQWMKAISRKKESVTNSQSIDLRHFSQTFNICVFAHPFHWLKLCQVISTSYNCYSCSQSLNEFFYLHLFRACVRYPTALWRNDSMLPDVDRVTAGGHFPGMDDLWPHYWDRSEILNLSKQMKIQINPI